MNPLQNCRVKTLFPCQDSPILSYHYTTSSSISVCPMLCLAAQSCSTLCNPVDCSPPGLSLSGDSPGKNTRILERVAIPSSKGSSQLRDRTQVSRIASRFFTSEPQVKSKNTGVGSQSPLQWIFLNQELNWGLLNCRQILYQLDYQGSPTWPMHIG